MTAFAYKLKADHDEMVASLSVVPREPGTIIDREGLDKELRENNVTFGLDEAAIAKAFAGINELSEGSEVIVIARGKFPKHGKDGYIDFKMDVSGAAKYQGSDNLEEDVVDYKEATRVVSVKPGDLIAELAQPVAGQKGYTLNGTELPAREGKKVTLRASSGVEADRSGTKFTATSEGRPIFFAESLEVSPLFTVEGDVDLSSGNVKFNGHVVVTGNVLDDFTIEANSVEIMGVVGAVKIRSGGPLSIRGGVNGRDKAEIYAEGDTNIKYINQAKVTVLANLKVSREIVNSRIWCRGRVKAEKIIGGDCLGLAGVEASILGSELGVSTTIEPGTNFEVRALDEQLGEMMEKIDEMLRPVRNFFGDRVRYRGLPQQKKDEFKQTYQNFTELKNRYIEVAEERDKILASSKYTPVKEVIARKLVYQDVFIRTDMCMRQFKTQLTGPVALIEDIDTSTIRPAAYVPGKGIVDDSEES